MEREPLSKKQVKGLLLSSGIGAKYSEHRLSEVLPDAVHLIEESKKWMNEDKHVMIVSKSPASMLVFAGAMLLNTGFSVYVIDMAMLVNAIDKDDQEQLTKLKEADLVGIAGFYDDSFKTCPFTPFQIRTAEGFLSYLVRAYGTSLLLDSNHPSPRWYSDYFKNLVINGAQVTHNLTA